jgi:hypothetical protein
VEESQVVLEWQAKARAEGGAAGQAEALRAKMLHLVRSRFGVEPPADLVAAVQAQADPVTLDRWFDLALDSPSLEAFRAAVGLP